MKCVKKCPDDVCGAVCEVGTMLGTDPNRECVCGAKIMWDENEEIEDKIMGYGM